MTRKQKLESRAKRASDRIWMARGNGVGCSLSYIEGYRAAMRDMRKVVRDARRASMDAGLADAFKRSIRRDFEQRLAVDQFLRPLL